MNVYFGAAISKRDQFQQEYDAIEAAILALGHQVIKAYDTASADLDWILSQSPDETETYYQQWLKATQKADIAVFESTFPSTVHIGTEIGVLIERGKPVICLFRDSDPVFMGGFHSTRFIKAQYNVETIKDVLSWSIEEAEQWLHRRFTMNLPAEMDTFLTKASKERNTSRSDVIRSLIEAEMTRMD